MILTHRNLCLVSAATPGDVCYSDAHCRLWDSDTHCDFLIPNLFGRCQCNSPMKQSGKSCYQFASPTEDGNPSASGPSPIDSPNTLSVGAWQPVTSASLNSTTPSPQTTESTATSHNPPQTSSHVSLTHPPTASLNYIPMEDMLFSTQATSLHESHSTMSLLTLSAVTSSEDTHASTTDAEVTTPLRAPAHVESSTKDQTQSSQTDYQAQTAKPETTGAYSFTSGLSQYTTPSHETTVSASEVSQSDTQYDASEKPVTLQSDSSEFSTEFTSPSPIASSTGKSERGVTSEQTR